MKRRRTLSTADAGPPSHRYCPATAVGLRGGLLAIPLLLSGCFVSDHWYITPEQATRPLDVGAYSQCEVNTDSGEESCSDVLLSLAPDGTYVLEGPQEEVTDIRIYDVMARQPRADRFYVAQLRDRKDDDLFFTGEIQVTDTGFELIFLSCSELSKDLLFYMDTTAIAEIDGLECRLEVPETYYAVTLAHKAAKPNWRAQAVVHRFTIDACTAC